MLFRSVSRPSGQFSLRVATAKSTYSTRPAAVFLGEFLHAEIVEAIAHAGQLTAVARPLGPVLTFGLLVLACGAPAQHRETIAEILLTAWDEERLTPSDLLAAWRSPWWDADWGHGLKPRTHSAAGAVATLDMVARAGGLALVWPLLTARHSVPAPPLCFDWPAP